MPTVSAADMARLRTRPHRIQWYMAVAPYGDPCFTAQINDPTFALQRGDMTIPYDNDAGGGNVFPNMTLWVGSQPGRWDIGRVRIRSINVGLGLLNVAENSEIEWQDNQYLSCPGEAGFREIWGVYPRIVEAGGVVTFYKDYDIAYTNEGDHLPPKANGGPPAIAFIDSTTGLATLQFVGEDSWVSEVGHGWHPVNPRTWVFPGGTPATINAWGTHAAPITVTWTDPGFRYSWLTVQDDQGETATVYVPTWIFEETGANAPFTNFEVTRLTGSLDSGWRCGVRAFTASATDFPPGALVVIFTRTWYGDEEVGIGGYTGRCNILFSGWIAEESIEFDYEGGTVSFDLDSNERVMRHLPSFSFTLEDEAAPADWYQMVDLNVDRALHHLLEYHSTANQVCHVETTGEMNTRPLAVQVFPDASLHAQAQTHLLKDAMCTFLADRQGVVRVRRDPNMMDAGDRNLVDNVCTIFQLNPNMQGDWMNTIDYDHDQHVPRIGFVRLGGFAYDTPLLSQAPGTAPLQQEREERVDGCILQDQNEANLWSGLSLTKQVNPFKEVPIELPGHWPVFDPALQEWVTLVAGDPLGRVIWGTDSRFIPRTVTFKQSAADSSSVVEMALEGESQILTGETVTIPVEPTPEPPPYPVPPVPPPITPPVGSIKAFLMWNTGDDDIGRTWDLQVATPAWTDIRGALTGGLVDFQYVQSSGTTVACWGLTSSGVWLCPDILAAVPVWNCVLTIAQLNVLCGGTTTGLPRCIRCSPDEPPYLIVAVLHAGAESPANHWFVHTHDWGASWTAVNPSPGGLNYPSVPLGRGLEIYGDTVWCPRSTPAITCYMFISTDKGHTWARSTTSFSRIVTSDAHPVYCPPYGGGSLLYFQHSSLLPSEGLWKSVDAGDNWSVVPPPAGYSGWSRQFSPGGAHYEGQNVWHYAYHTATGIYHAVESDDAGVTWPNLLYNTGCGSVPVDIRIAQKVHVLGWPPSATEWTVVRGPTGAVGSCGAILVYTEDDGATLQDKSGDWLAVFGTFSAISPDCRWNGGFGLPRVGVNA